MTSIPILTIENASGEHLKTLLGEPGKYRVVQAKTADEVPGLRNREAFDAIVALSGEANPGCLELLRSLREKEDRVPFVMVLEKDQPAVIDEVLALSADYYVLSATPGSRTGLRRVIERVLDCQRQKNAVAMLNKKLNLVGSVTRHDVLNQLTAIVGYNELLGMMIEDPKLLSFLEKERYAIDKIQRQFKFAKDYQNIGIEPPKWQAMRDIVSLICDQLDVGNVKITLTAGEVSIFADPLFEKAIFNLFENALRHGDKVSEITISLHEAGAGGVLIVEDNGVGIMADEKTRIFERGYGKSTGWGLFLIAEILAITGLTITENGEPGKGARFEIGIPAGKYRIETHLPA